MRFHQPKKLPDLIRLSFSFDFLQVHQFRDIRMHEYMMASSDTVKPKPESLDQRRICRQRDATKYGGPAINPRRRDLRRRKKRSKVKI
jgi:hypothetical protein